MNRHRLYLCRVCLTPTVHRVDGRGLCLPCQAADPPAPAHVCVDCGVDISDRGGQASRCKPCAAAHKKAYNATWMHRQRRMEAPPLIRSEPNIGRESLDAETLATLAEYHARGRDAREKMVI